MPSRFVVLYGMFRVSEGGLLGVFLDSAGPEKDSPNVLETLLWLENDALLEFDLEVGRLDFSFSFRCHLGTTLLEQTGSCSFKSHCFDMLSAIKI